MRRELGMLLALILMCAGIGWSNPAFYNQSNLFNTDRQIALLGIFAVGISFVIITGGIDLSVGSVIGLTGVIIAKISSPVAQDGFKQPLWIGLCVALGIAVLIGLVQGLLITRLKLQPFIVTLGFMLLLRGVAQVITEGGTISMGGISKSPLKQLAFGGYLMRNGSPLLPYVVVILLIVVVLASYLLHFTVFGRYVYAIGGNRDAAEYSGIPVKRVETLVYVISAGLAGVAGVCWAGYVGSITHMNGMGYELSAIAAAVIGGVSLRGGEGVIPGVIIGSMIMRVIQNGITVFKIHYTDAHGNRVQRGLDNNYEFVIVGSVILMAVILDQLAHLFQDRRRRRKAGPRGRARRRCRSLNLNRNKSVLF